MALNSYSIVYIEMIYHNFFEGREFQLIYKNPPSEFHRVDSIVVGINDYVPNAGIFPWWQVPLVYDVLIY